MAGRREQKPLVKRIVQLYEGDWERLQKFHGGKGNMKCSKAIRMIIHHYCNRVEAKYRAEKEKEEEIEI